MEEWIAAECELGYFLLDVWFDDSAYFAEIYIWDSSQRKTCSLAQGYNEAEAIGKAVIALGNYDLAKQNILSS